MENERFKAADALKTLKTFQRRTVDYVFDRFYSAEECTHQFLVADEVGLGKTMVAKGLIARTIEHLWDKVERIDVLYICSNQAIAAQNLNRLNVLGRKEIALPTRMTLVPLQLKREEHLVDNNTVNNKVNFISLTPGTTFHLRSTTGVAEERAFLFHMLRDMVASPNSLRNVLQVGADAQGFASRIELMSLDDIDHGLIDRFRDEVRRDESLFKDLGEVSNMFHRRRDSYPEEMVLSRNKLIGVLRGRLSHVCVDALQPDLIIMDEFQRFPKLLHGNDESAQLARELFNYHDHQNAARTLLLSATPYRMLTLNGDDETEGDHYKDFFETLTFLFGQQRGREIANTLDQEMRKFRLALQGLPSTFADASACKTKVESMLRRVMCRTERVSSTAARDSMVCEPLMPVTVLPGELRQAIQVAAIARALDAPDVIEYWKSAPYLLNFMREYKLKRAIKERQGSKAPVALADLISRAKSACLSRARLNAYRPLEPANGRMRALMDDVFKDGLEQNLWIPPSLPYYQAASTVRFTKGLVFSSWSMVPEAIAATLSYEAERRMGAASMRRGYFSKRRTRPLQFRKEQDRLTGMRAMLLIYPSPTLAKLADPLLVMTSQPETLSYSDMRHEIAERLTELFQKVRSRSGGEGDGSAWEWAMPAAIDGYVRSGVVNWLGVPDGMIGLAGEDAFREHVLELQAAASRGNHGPVSDDILDLLVDLALGSPAICALRALHRIAPDLAWDDHRLLSAASRVAWGFRVLFNQYEAVALLRRGENDVYWRRVLTFSAEHNLQAVLDEYAHFLVESEGLGSAEQGKRVTNLGQAMLEAVSIRPSQIEVDNPKILGGRIQIDSFQMRGRFAMRLGDYSDEGGVVARLGSVRAAFNSPFRPFVLATTSVGQEGLDFHPYCYRVYHWNLPSNPVDLEQREGRVHRFKGHAVRLNVAHNHGSRLRGRGNSPTDPWAEMFSLARNATAEDTDLVPYWVCEGPVKVERRVPILPFSREIKRLEWLKRSLTVYRLAFGQPRQDDLLQYLNGLINGEVIADEIFDLQIQLRPAIETPLEII